MIEFVTREADATRDCAIWQNDACVTLLIDRSVIVVDERSIVYVRNDVFPIQVHLKET